MKKLTLIVLLVALSLLVTNCGPGKMDEGKAKKVIMDEANAVIDEALKQVKDEMTDADKKELAEKRKQFEDGLKVSDIKSEGKEAEATVSVKMGDKTETLGVKFVQGDKGWAIDSVKGPDGSWIPYATIKMFAKKALGGFSTTGKIKATMGDMKSIGTAIQDYMTDNYCVPQVETLAEMEKILSPFYIRKLPLKDGWGNDFIYSHGTGETMENFAIGSGGSDGKFEGFEQSGQYTDSKGKDIIYENGEFKYFPEVK